MKIAKKNKQKDGLWVLSAGVGSDRLFNEVLLSGAKVAFAFHQRSKADRSVIKRKDLMVAATFIETKPFIGGLMKLPGQGYMDILALDNQYIPLTRLGVEGIKGMGMEVAKVISDMSQTYERFHQKGNPEDMVASLCFGILQSKLGTAPLYLTELELAVDYPSPQHFIDDALGGGDEWLRAFYDFFMSCQIEGELP